MSKNVFCLCLVLFICLVILGCGTKGITDGFIGGTGTITGKALLSGQSSHSGIVVSVAGTSFLGTTTASDGSYTLGVPAGTVTINFTKSGYAGQSRAVSVGVGITTTVATVTLNSSCGHVSGTVILQGQTDHSGITVLVNGTGFSTSTNASGVYYISDLSTGNITLIFSKSGYVSITTSNTISEGVTTSISVTLEGVASAKGNIAGIATLGGTAASGITVEVYGTTTSTQTGSNGSYLFSGLTAGTYILNYSYSGYFSQSKQVAVNGGKTTEVATVNLTSNKGSITGTVDLSRTSDESGAVVEVDGTSLNATTNQSGSYTISEVPKGTYSLTISKIGYVTGNTTNVVVVEGSAKTLSEITLRKPFEVISEYSLSSIGVSGTPFSMTYLSDYLYISTDEKIYKIGTVNQTIIAQTTVTQNYISMIAIPDDGIVATQDGIMAYPTVLGSIWNCGYDSDLNLIEIDEQEGVVKNNQAVAWYGAVYNVVYYTDQEFVKVYVAGNNNERATQNISINETGIVGLYYSFENDRFYACNSSSIYVYRFINPYFILEKSQDLSSVGAASNCVDITYNGTYIWTLDATTGKLYKHYNN